MPSESYRVELNLPDDNLFVMPADLRAGPANTHMQLPAPTWTASYSASPRRPFTVADAPSSPASSTASQKFEVKRLLSRPADLASSPRPLTTFDSSTSNSLAGPSSGATVKRSNSASRSLLKRRPSKGHTESSAPAPAPITAPVGPRQRTTTAPALLAHSRPSPYSNSLLPFDTSFRQTGLPPAPYTPNSIASAPARTLPSSPGIAPISASSSSTLTPASAYAMAYAQRTRMAVGDQGSDPRAGRTRDRESDKSGYQARGTSETPTPTRHPFEGVGNGRLVALGDPTDETLSLTLTSNVPALALAGFGVAGATGEGGSASAAGSGTKGEGVFGLTRKVSARFGRRKTSRAGATARPSGMDVQSDEEREVSWKEWNQEKEKAGLRGIGLTAAPTTVRLGEKIMSGEMERGKMARKRLSRHLSIEEFRDNIRVENEMGTRFEMWDPRSTEAGRDQDKGKDREKENVRVVDGSAAVRSERGKEKVESETRAKEKDTGRERKFSATLGRTDGAKAFRDGGEGTGSQLSSRRDNSLKRDDLHHSSSQPSNRHPSISHKDDLRTFKKTDSRPDVIPRSNSTPGHGYAGAEMPRSTGTVSPESHKSGGGMLWRLVKKMSTGTLKEKRSSHPEKAPPVPRLPATLPSSRRSSVVDDYGEEVRPELSRFGASRSASGHPTTYQTGSELGGGHSGSGSTHSGPSSFGGYGGTLPIGPQTQAHSVQQQHRHRSASGGRPSLTNEWRPSMTNESSIVSTSPKSSFGRTQSPRTSMSSYVDVGDEVSPPPLPMPLVGKHIVAPCELAQYTPGMSGSSHHTPATHINVHREQPAGSPSLPPPKRPARAAQRPREKPSPAPTPAPVSAPLSPTSIKSKPRPNVLRRPTRLGDDHLASGSPRSPRSASMGMPSPRGRSQTNARAPDAGDSRSGSSGSGGELDTPIARPRSNSLGTVFTFREMDGGKRKEKLTEQEKVAKFEQLLEASDKAGGTLHARLQEKLLSDTMRLSGNFGSEAGGM